MRMWRTTTRKRCVTSARRFGAGRNSKTKTRNSDSACANGQQSHRPLAVSICHLVLFNVAAGECMSSRSVEVLSPFQTEPKAQVTSDGRVAELDCSRTGAGECCR